MQAVAQVILRLRALAREHRRAESPALDHGEKPRRTQVGGGIFARIGAGRA